MVALAVGGYLFDERNKTKAELSAEQVLLSVGASTPSRVAELQAEADRQRQGIVISMAVGGSALVLGAVLFGIGTAKKKGAGSSTTSITTGPGLAGLTIIQRF